jgi:plastocyanin
MNANRRTFLRTAGVALAGGALAGCSGQTPDGEDATPTPGATDTPTGGGGDEAAAAVDVAVAAEWNVYRARAFDAAHLGLAGEAGVGARVAADTFARFENATGEFGAHEVLEATSQPAYEAFEAGLGDLRAALESGENGAAQEAARAVATQLHSAQLGRTSPAIAGALDLQFLGCRATNAELLATAGAFEAAGAVAHGVSEAFENAQAHALLEKADHERYEAFEGALEAIETAAEKEDAAAVREQSRAALRLAVEGAYAITGAEAAGAAHLATFQARGFDAATLSRLGGASDAEGHAATLTAYRLRAHDAAWLAAAGEADFAATMAADVFAHFEGARAHEALEEANYDAYEGFEGGLADLKTAIESDGDVAGALAAVDENLVVGIRTLAGGNAAVFESAFFRGRIGDARERYHLGQSEAAADLITGLFEVFEGNELGFHETFEETDHEGYEAFEDALGALVEGFAAGDDAKVESTAATVLDRCLSFETSVATTAVVSAAESAYMSSRAFDAAALSALGESARASAAVEATFGFFESGAGGFHEALEEADHDRYESFEAKLGAVGEGDAYPAAKAFFGEATAAAYAVVGSAAGSLSEEAAAVAKAGFQSFEGAQVHGRLEESDHVAYEGFEGALSDLIAAIESGGDVAAALSAYADATLAAQFAVAGAAGKAPVGGDSGGAATPEASLSGGPNVVSAPADADHTVELHTVSFEPVDLTVKAGETVAFEHVEGEAHTVTASQEELPGGATYWASGGFESQQAAEAGWKDGTGAVQSGQAFVHTFETAGTHHYFCIPHEAAGMAGTITVE